MSLLELALTFVRAYCEKHTSCGSCRLWRSEHCQMQMIPWPPQDWDIETMIKRARGRSDG